MRANTLYNLPPNVAGASSSAAETQNPEVGRSPARSGNVATPQKSVSKANQEDSKKARDNAKRTWDAYQQRNKVVEKLYETIRGTTEFKVAFEKKEGHQKELHRCMEDRLALKNSALPDSIKKALIQKSWKETDAIEPQIINAANELLDMLEPHKKILSGHLESKQLKEVGTALNEAIQANTGYGTGLTFKELKELKKQLKNQLASYEAYKQSLQNEINCLDAQRLRWKARLVSTQHDAAARESTGNNIDATIAGRLTELGYLVEASNLLLTIDKHFAVHIPYGKDKRTDFFRLTTLNFECAQRERLENSYVEKRKADVDEKRVPIFTPLKPLKEVLLSETNDDLYEWWSRVKNEFLPALKKEFDTTNYSISREDIYLKEYAILNKANSLSSFAHQGHHDRKHKQRIRGIDLQNSKTNWIDRLGLIPIHISKKCAQHLDEDIALYLRSLSDNIQALRPLGNPSFGRANEAMRKNDLNACEIAYAELLPLTEKSEDAGEYIQYCIAGVKNALEKAEKTPTFSEDDHRLMTLLTELLESLSSEFADLTRLVRQTLGQLIQNGVDPRKAAALTLRPEHQDGLNKINWSLLKNEDAEIDNLFLPSAAATGSVDLSRTSVASSSSRNKRKRAGKRKKSTQSRASVTAEASEESTLNSGIGSLKLTDGQDSFVTGPESFLPEASEDIRANQEEAEKVFDGVKKSVDDIEISLERDLGNADEIIDILDKKRADVFKEDAKRLYASPDGVRIYYESAINKKISQIRSLKVALQKIDRLESKDPNVLKIRTEIMVLHLENKRKQEELIAESIVKTATAHTLDPKERMFDFMEKHQLIRGAELIIPDAPLRPGDWVHKWVVTLNSGESFLYHLKYDEKNPADDTKFTHSSLKRMDQQFDTITLLREQGRTDEYLFRGAVEGVKILDTLKKYKAGPEEEVLQNIRRYRTD